MAFVLLLIVLASGCSTSPYFTDRKRDVLDVFSFSAGMGAGGKARIGPLQTGLGVDFPAGGLRGGDSVRVLYTQRDVQLLFMGEEFVYETGTWSRQKRGKTFYASSLRARHYDHYSSQKEESEIVTILRYWPFFHVLDPGHPEVSEDPVNYAYYSQIEVFGGCFFTFRAGFNPGELLDFLLGWFAVDLYNDDIEQEAQSEEEGVSCQELPSEQRC